MHIMYQSNRSFNIPPVIPRVFEFLENFCSRLQSICVVYKFECDLCDADYVGYTARHLHVHQRINEHKYSAIGGHLEQRGLKKTDLADKQFLVLKKCRSKSIV